MIKKRDPTISVVIPVYNASITLFNTLESLTEQIFTDFEIILVDDNSNDNSYDIAKEFVSKISLKVIKNKTNLGPAISRNKGIKSASANIIAFTDSDCVVDKKWLENIDNVFKNSDTSVLVGSVKVPPSNFIGDSISALGFPAGGAIGFEKIWHVSKEGFTDHISSCNFAAKKEIFEKYGLFDESFPLAGGEDPELSYRLSKNGVKIKYCPDVLVYHEPRKELLSFIKWMIYRGRSNYYFRKKVGKVGNFVKLRIWSSKNILKEYYKNSKIILILPLLVLSFILQQYGLMIESLKIKK